MTTNKRTLEEKFLEAWKKHSPFGPEGMPCQQYLLNAEWTRPFDFAWPATRVAVEIQGFGFGHQRIAGMARDAQKMRDALQFGWIVVPYTSKCIGSLELLELAVWEVSEIIRLRCGHVSSIQTGSRCGHLERAAE